MVYPVPNAFGTGVILPYGVNLRVDSTSDNFLRVKWVRPTEGRDENALPSVLTIIKRFSYSQGIGFPPMTLEGGERASSSPSLFIK